MAKSQPTATARTPVRKQIYFRDKDVCESAMAEADRRGQSWSVFVIRAIQAELEKAKNGRD
jgi:predicted HicB family RNase H-like nuclease